MPYTLTQEDINSITDLEVAFSTTRLLPAWEDIPEDFKKLYKGNIYVELTDAIFCGGERPKGNVKFNEGFDETQEGFYSLQRCVTAHMRSFEPKHEHKIAGIAYMISKVCTITPDKE